MRRCGEATVYDLLTLLVVMVSFNDNSDVNLTTELAFKLSLDLNNWIRWSVNNFISYSDVIF